MANNTPRQLRVGDKIRVPVELGFFVIIDHEITISEILYQEPWEWRNAYYIEFRDQNGVYHNWQQKHDGGEAILVESEVT